MTERGMDGGVHTSLLSSMLSWCRRHGTHGVALLIGTAHLGVGVLSSSSIRLRESSRRKRGQASRAYGLWSWWSRCPPEATEQRPVAVPSALPPPLIEQLKPGRGYKNAKETWIDGRERRVVLETGKLARLADGSVTLHYDDVVFLATAVSARQGSGPRHDGVLPLTVEFREKAFATGRIPRSTHRREGAPTEREVLVSRFIDRALRPLFPKGYTCDTQVMATLLSSALSHETDVMALNAASAALVCSDIPFNGPVGAVRIGRVKGRLLVNPTLEEIAASDLDLVVAGTREGVVMIEASGAEVPEAEFMHAVQMAHTEIQRVIDPQERLAGRLERPKRDPGIVEPTDHVILSARHICFDSFFSVFSDPNHTKQSRENAVKQITRAAKATLEGAFPGVSSTVLNTAVLQQASHALRRLMVESGRRCDGRQRTDVRELFCEVEPLPDTHGSALFQRGSTQALGVVTLGPPEDELRWEGRGIRDSSKHFFTHYTFPTFAVNETGRMGIGRREIGHGILAEKALQCVMPSPEQFPYTVRLNSEILMSDGSSSMASVSAGCMALMDAGVHVSASVAGVSIGLLSSDSGVITRDCLLTDITGLEDHLGEMDFKLAGTCSGITACQMDLKRSGIPVYTISMAVEDATRARMHVLRAMKKSIAKPRAQPRESAPRHAFVQIDPNLRNTLIGPSGVTIRALQNRYDARLSVDDNNSVSIFCPNESALNSCREHVLQLAGALDTDDITSGHVTGVRPFGVFLELGRGRTGFAHVSDLGLPSSANLEQQVKIGDEMDVKVIGNKNGRLKLSRWTMTPPLDNEGGEEDDDDDNDNDVREEAEILEGNGVEEKEKKEKNQGADPPIKKARKPNSLSRPRRMPATEAGHPTSAGLSTIIRLLDRRVMKKS